MLFIQFDFFSFESRLSFDDTSDREVVVAAAELRPQHVGVPVYVIYLLGKFAANRIRVDNKLGCGNLVRIGVAVIYEVLRLV